MKRLSVCISLLSVILSSLPLHAAFPDPVRFSAALEIGNVRQARAWLDEGLDPDFEGHLIGTGLMIGAWEGNIPLMALFLERGANIHATNRFGETALMLAAWKNRRAAMQWLIERGAQANRPEREWTALHYATFAGHADLAEDLVAAGADVNARSTNGSTVLMMAAREGHASLAQRLVAAGANPALKNDFGDDALSWALRQGNFDIAKSLADAASYADRVRDTTARPAPAPVRSVPVPDAVEEYLRMARLAESGGRRDEALAAYRKALAELKAQEPLQTSGAEGTAKAAKAPARSPSAVVIRARRDQPNRQVMTFVYSGEDTAGIDRLLEQAHAAEAAGSRQEALQLFRQVSERLKVQGQ